MTADMVDHPAHYGGEDDQYEVIKVAEAWGFHNDAYLFNILKYIRRDKGNQLEDLKKARFYLERKIKRLEAVIPAGTVTGDKLPSEPLVKSQYIEIYTNPADPFAAYCIYAHRDWTINSLASMTATASGKKDTGAYGISLSPEGGLLQGSATVGWLLRTFPPERHEYYLRKA